MATVRKRILPSGLVCWRASYTDGAGVRRTKQFPRKSEGDAWLVETRHDIARGLHTPGSMSPTVKEAAALWIKHCNEKRLEAMTVKGYEEHVDLHIVPFIGAKKLVEITVPVVNAFADQLREAGRSSEMIRRVIRSLGGIFKEARRRGLSRLLRRQHDHLKRGRCPEEIVYLLRRPVIGHADGTRKWFYSR